MILIGDVHGLFHDYNWMIETYCWDNTLQLGDFGIGFPDSMDVTIKHEGQHLFIRGNHDNPEVCRKHPNYAGDYGCLSGDYVEGRYHKLFFISGAWSIDYQWRTPGISWWEDEQLSERELSDAIELYEKEQPEIVVSHDCPFSILQHLYAQAIPTRTGQAFDVMLKVHEPSVWIFAHHHKSWKRKLGYTNFICLNEMEYLNISQNIFGFGDFCGGEKNGNKANGN